MADRQPQIWPEAGWDDAFENTAYIPGAADFPDAWARRAAAYRADGVRYEQASYGAAARETLDFIWPETTPKGLAVFVHGGYWKATDPSFWTHYAEGARANGWAVCLPGYTLAPEISITGIVDQIARALTVAAGRVAGPIRLAGHSAGGHLVARMCCAASPLPDAVWARVQHVLSISGLHDLRPLLQTRMNTILQLDPAEAAAQSPVLHVPRPGAGVTAWVGGAERPEFLRQAQMLDVVWKGLGVPIAHVIDAGHDHFSVIEGLCDPASAITQAFVKDKGARDAAT